MPKKIKAFILILVLFLIIISFFAVRWDLPIKNWILEKRDNINNEKEILISSFKDPDNNLWWFNSLWQELAP